MRGGNLIPRASPSGGGGAVGKAPPPNEGEALGTRLRGEGRGESWLFLHCIIDCRLYLTTSTESKIRRKRRDKQNKRKFLVSKETSKFGLSNVLIKVKLKIVHSGNLTFINTFDKNITSALFEITCTYLTFRMLPPTSSEVTVNQLLINYL